MKKTIAFALRSIGLLTYTAIFLCLSLTSHASGLVYTIQTGSFAHMSEAQQQFDSILQRSNREDLDHLRIEKVGEYYSVRIGNFENRITAEHMLRRMGPEFSTSLIIQAYIKDERIKKIYKDEFSSVKQKADAKIVSEALLRQSEPPVIEHRSGK